MNKGKDTHIDKIVKRTRILLSLKSFPELWKKTSLNLIRPDSDESVLKIIDYQFYF